MSINVSYGQPYRAASSMIPLLKLARATLLLRPSNSKPKPAVTARQLEKRAIFLFKHFRLRLNRRQKSSIADKTFSKLCANFISYHPGRALSLHIQDLAGKAMQSATSTTFLQDIWTLVITFLLQRKPPRTDVNWPLERGQKELKILFWNCNGNHTGEHKRTLLNETAKDKNLDIISLVETKLVKPRPPIEDFTCTSYTEALNRRRTRQRIQQDSAGGIVVGKARTVNVTMRTKHTFTGFIEAVASRIKRTGSSLDFTMITCYIPPFSICSIRGAFENSSFLEQIRSLYGTPLLLVADANCDIATWTGRGTKTIRTLLSEGWELKSSVHDPTSLHTTRGTCIDIVLTRDFPYNSSCQVLPMSTTDHQGILITISSGKATKSHPGSCNRPAAIAFAKALEERDHECPQYLMAEATLQSLPPPATSNFEDAPIFGHIINLVNSFEEQTRTLPRASDDRLYNTLKGIFRNHYKLIVSLRNHGTSTNSHRHLKNILSKLVNYKKEANRLIHLIRCRASTQDAAAAISVVTQDIGTNAIIRRIERACNPRSNLIDFTTLDRAQVDSHKHFWETRWSSPYRLPQDRHDLLQEFLPSTRSHAPRTQCRAYQAFSITHKPDGEIWLTDEAELFKAIQTLCNGRAPGPSGLPVDFFKLTSTFHQDLCTLFNSIITELSTPPQFAPCRLILLYKAGLISEPKNYRPINLTEAGFRIFEAIIRLRMNAWTESILHQNQYGFRSSQSTMSALLSIVTEIHSAISNGSPLYACFLDAVKAFDRVPHDAILEACMGYGLCSSSCRLLESIISKHSSAIIDPSTGSKIFDIPVNCGVLQGGINSPPLYTLFANTHFDDLPPEDPSDTRLYADDRTAFTDDPALLQDSLDNLGAWAATRNLLHDGNELLVFNAPDPPPILVQGQPLSLPSSTVCLGLTLHKDGTVARANLVTKANHSRIKLSSLWTRARPKIPFSTLKTLIARYFMPTTTYGSALSTTDVGISLDKTVYKIIRGAVSCHPSTNTTLLLEFTGIIRPSIRIQQEVISLLCRSLVNSSSIIQAAIRKQFALKLPFSTKVLKLLDLLKLFPLCGPSLATQLQDILSMPPVVDTRQPRLSFTPPPFVPSSPSKTHMLCFTDGSKTDTGACGCATVLLIGCPGDGKIITTSFFLPNIHDNNVAELQAIINAIDQAVAAKASDFPDLASITIISDSMNSVNSIQGIFLYTDPSFLTLLHKFARTLSNLKLKLSIKWVKAHDDGNSPFNELADTWADRSIAEQQQLTETTPLTPEDVARATLPIPWHDSEAPPQDAIAIIRRFQTIAKNAILLQEDSRFRQQLTRYISPDLINFPGTGSRLLNSSTQPNGHFLLTLRRDPEEHFNAYPKLAIFSETCPWCDTRSKSSNTHLFLECSLNRISNRDRRKIISSRRHILGIDAPLDTSSLKQHFVALTSSTMVPPANADSIIKSQAKMRHIYLKYRSRFASGAADSDSQDSQDSQDPQDRDDSHEGAGQDSTAPRQTHHGPAARQLILSRIEASRTAEEIASVFAHYRITLDVYDRWSKQHGRQFFRPRFYRQWLHRCEDYLTILNCPTWELRYKAYLQYEASDRPWAKCSTRPVSSTSTGLQPRYAGRASTNMTGFRSKFQEMRDFINTKLLRHSIILPLQNPRPNRPRSKPYKPPHSRRNPSPPWAFHLDWSFQLSTPLVEAWLAAPTSETQRLLVRSVWPEEWSKTAIIQTHMKIDPDLYCRQTLVNSKKGKGLLQLFDLIRDALANGEISTVPAFPELTAAATAKLSTAKTYQAPFQSAALILIFTPIEILRRRVSIFVNPASISYPDRVNFPDTLRPFPPRLDTHHRVSDMLSLTDRPDLCIGAARIWARQQMQIGRIDSPSFFPEPPPEIDGSDTTFAGSFSSAFDDDISSSSSSDSDN
jgi:ribonuclease HI